MSYEITVGLMVVDGDRYAQYRLEIRPLLEAAGAAFRYDLDVARVIHSEDSTTFNRAFVLRFRSQAAKEAFFADPRYVEIRRRLFDPSVTARVAIGERLVEEVSPSEPR